MPLLTIIYIVTPIASIALVLLLIPLGQAIRRGKVKGGKLAKKGVFGPQPAD